MPNELGFGDKIIAHGQARRSRTTSMSFSVRSSFEHAMHFFSEQKGLVGLAPLTENQLSGNMAK